MIKDRQRRLAGLRKTVLGIAATSLLVLALAPSAGADPGGDFAVFVRCPVQNPAVELCLFMQTDGGELKIGSKAVPLSKPITLQGGQIVDGQTGQEKFVVASNGETLSKTPQSVPGGLLGTKAPAGWPKALQDSYNQAIEEGFTGVTMTAELVGNPGISLENLLIQSGIALSLPVRLHLSSATLGSGCYVGSKASPVSLELTTGLTSPPGPNTPIEGAVGNIEFDDNYELVIVSGNELVDNAFSEPAAEGCGGVYAYLFDPFVDELFGLPSASGHNTATIKDTLQVATAQGVINSQVK